MCIYYGDASQIDRNRCRRRRGNYGNGRQSAPPADVEKRLGRQVWFSASFNALTAEKIAALYIVAIDILSRRRRSVATRLEKRPILEVADP